MRIRVPLLPRWLRLVGVLGIVAAIFYYSVLTVPSRPLVRSAGPLWDKQLHFVSYATLALALAYATVGLRERPLLRGMLVIGLAVLFGVMIELIQGQLSTRTFSIGDALANGLGAVLVTLWFLLEKRIRYRRIEVPELGLADP